MTEKLKQKRPPRKPFWALLLILLLVILNLNIPHWFSHWYWLYQPKTLVIHPNLLIEELHRAIVYGALFIMTLLLVVVAARNTFRQNRFNLAATFILIPVVIMTAWGNLANNLHYDTYELRSDTMIDGVTYYVGTSYSFDSSNVYYKLFHFIYTCEQSILCSVRIYEGGTVSSTPIAETDYPPPSVIVGGDNRAIYGYINDKINVIGELGFEGTLNIPAAAISAENAGQLARLLDFVSNNLSATWSPDGDYLLNGSYNRNNPTIYRLPDFELVPDRLDASGNVEHFTFSPDGKRVLGYTYGEPFHLWDWETRELLYTQSHLNIEAAYPNPDGSVVAVIGRQPNVTLYDVANQTEIARFDNQLDTFWSHNGSYSPDGRYIATISQHLRVWDVETGTTLALDVPEPFYGGCAVDFSPNSQLLVATETDTGYIYVFDLVTGERLYTFTSGETGIICGLDFSPDGKLLATGNSAGQLQIWDLEIGSQVANIQAHDVTVFSTQFHPSGTMLMTSSSQDNHIRVWGIAD
jgi:Tol biopolymer transport system component